MIETVFLDWGLAFGTGVMFAIAGRREIAQAKSKMRTRAFVWGLAYLHIGILAISLTLYSMNRDWMWMYWVDPRALPAGITVVAFALYEVCFLAGFFIASEASSKAAWAIAGAAFIAISTLEATARTRIFHFGTLEEFQAGAAPAGMSFRPFSVQPEWWVAIIGGVLSMIALGPLLLSLARRSRAV